MERRGRTRLRGVGLIMALTAVTACGSKNQAAASGGTAAPPNAVAPADPSNPLIGVWKLSGYTPNGNLPGVTCQVADMTFTPTQTTQVSSAGPNTMAVSYIVEPTKVAVVTDTGLANAVMYLMLDQDDMQIDAMLDCKYHRVG